MALTGAERAKRYREKLKQNPEIYENYKKKQLQRLKKAQKKINELSDEEKIERRKKWREQKKRQKEKQKPCLPFAQVSNTNDHVSSSLQIKHRDLSRKYITAIKTINKYKVAFKNVRNRLYRAQKKYEQEIMKLQVERDKLEAQQELLEISISEAYSDCKIRASKQLLNNLAILIKKVS